MDTGIHKLYGFGMKSHNPSGRTACCVGMTSGKVSAK